MVFTKATSVAMPAGKDSGGGDGGGGGGGATNAAGRTTFRPPWVRDGPNPLPVPTAPWTLKNASRRGSNNTEEAPATIQTPKLRKTTPNSKVTVSQAQENGTSKETFVKPQLKPVPPKEPTKLQSKEVKVPVKLNSVKKDMAKAEDKRIQNLKSEDPDVIDKATPAARNALVRQESMRRLSQTPAPPPMPPPAPALPKLIETKPLSRKQEDVLNQLRSRPKVRPDWTAMLKEIESNKKLKHVECNDRSKPLLPKVKAKGQFLYESEKQNAHNELLKQIQTGINLKKVVTNDRSKPLLEGLRKFRRQMTIEEQIIKSQSMASIPPEEIAPEEVDEMDDIDKVRDDLQSTKQMLALELRNKEAQIRENKRLQARIQNLEAELEKERNAAKTRSDSGAPSTATVTGSSAAADEKLIKLLKTEAEQARKTSEELEKKFHDTAEQLDNTKSALEEAKKQNQLLEKRLQEALAGKKATLDKKESVNKEDDVSDYEVEESESDDDLDEEAKKEKKALKEVKVMRNKLRSFKNKQDNAKKERVALKQQMKTLQAAIKDEKKKFKSLQKEVNKMAALMKDTGDDDDEDEDEEKESDEEETESESESETSESETESDDSESEKSMSEPEDAPVEKKKANLTKRTTRHENILGALKKTNYMLKTNVERLQDDLNKQKELTQGLQEDLDSVLAELG